MSPSPARLPLVVEVLCTADAAYGLIADIHRLAVSGRQTDALASLAYLADAVEAHRPILRGVLGAQRQAAQAHDLTERVPVPRLVCGAFMGVAQPKPDAANPETHSATATPTDPAA